MTRRRHAKNSDGPRAHFHGTDSGDNPERSRTPVQSRSDHPSECGHCILLNMSIGQRDHHHGGAGGSAGLFDEAWTSPSANEAAHEFQSEKRIGEESQYWDSRASNLSCCSSSRHVPAWECCSIRLCKLMEYCGVVTNIAEARRWHSKLTMRNFAHTTTYR